MKDFVRRYFRFEERGSNFHKETVGGTTTFLTMAYIIFVQPAILSECGMDFGAVMTATCLASALATILMGLYARYPIALAPAMGHNAFFAFTVCGIMGYSWQVGLAAIFISGLLFIILSLAGFMTVLINAVPGCLKDSIAVGIGLFITFIGLQYSGIIVDTPGVLVGLGDLKSTPVFLGAAGTLVIAVLMIRGIRGSILYGIIFTAVMGMLLGVIEVPGKILSAPPPLKPTLLKLDLKGLMDVHLLEILFIFFFLDLFDTVGTLIGVSKEGNLLKDNKLPRAREAMISDAVGTSAGALMGTSTVTSYIESAAGISQGARTGFANLITGLFFLLALFFSPVIAVVGGGYELESGVYLYPAIAPALIIVGCLMMKPVRDIDWEDVSEAVPAFLTMIIIPFSFSITEGIAFGFITYTVCKAASGRPGKVHWVVYLFALLFLLRYLFLLP